MVSSGCLSILLAASALMAQQPASNLLDKSGPEAKAAQPALPPLTPEKRGDIYMARKEYREAIDAYKNAPQDSPVIWNKIGIAYHQLVQLDAAKKNYEKAIKLNPQYAEAINNLGTIYYAKRSYRKAISQYNKALKYTPDSASIYSNLGTALFARKKFEEAFAMYQKALSLDPEVFEHRNTYGVLLQERNVEDRAKFHFYMAKTYAKAKMPDRALEYMRKALEEGFKDKEKFTKDPDFALLQELPEFQKLLALEPKVL
jgi:tetratricopeptide (TPR) repeat protein